MHNPTPLLKRRAYFNALFPAIKGFDARQDISSTLPNSCPCCGYMTLSSRCQYDICAICFWEDDGQDEQEANAVWGGPNGDYSLTSYRVEMHDWLEQLKTGNTDLNENERLAGKTLNELDNLIEHNKTDKELVLSKIKKACELFDNLRDLENEDVLNWKFVKE